jgi:transposase
MKRITTIGIDLAKNSFQLHGVDANGKAVLRKTLRRDHVIPFFANRPECLVGGGMRQFGLLGARH